MQEEQVQEIKLGELIRQRRVELGMSIEDLHFQTRIPLQFLTSIEANELEDLPSSGYALGYLRSIAVTLQLDFRLLSDLYRSQIRHVTVPSFLLRYLGASEFIEDLKTWARIIAMLAIIWTAHYYIWQQFIPR